MRFKKIKYADGVVTLDLEEKPNAQREEQKVITSREKPHPDFEEALQLFAVPALELCELDESYAEGLAVRSVSLSVDDEGYRGLVVTMLRKLSSVPAPLVLNTPHVSERPNNEGDCTMTGDLLEAMERMIDEARAFVTGKRAQGGLFDDPNVSVSVNGQKIESEAAFADVMEPVIAAGADAIRRRGRAKAGV